MRVLAYTSPARGHLYPLVPVLDALHERGHEVALRTLEGEVPRMRERGFGAAAIVPELERLEHDDYAARGVRTRLRRSLDVFARRAAHDLDDLRAAIAGERPDVLLVDVNAWGAQAAAEASGLPWGVAIPYPVWLPAPEAPPFGPGLAPARGPLGRARDRALRPLLLDSLLRELLPRVNAARAAAGVPPLARGEEVFTRPPLVLSFTAEPFEYPRAAWPDGFRLIGPCAWDPPAEPPAWLAADERPIVLVSTSSEYQGDERLVRTAFAALAGRDDLLVVATMPSAATAAIAAPPNARVERFCPHGPLLARAAAVVCHGGMGVTQKALAAGVPVCAVPFGRDQLEVARRVEVSGAGTRLAARRLSAGRLRAAVDGALSRRPGAARIAAAFAAAGGGPAGADAVEALAA